MLLKNKSKIQINAFLNKAASLNPSDTAVFTMFAEIIAITEGKTETSVTKTNVKAAKTGAERNKSASERKNVFTSLSNILCNLLCALNICGQTALGGEARGH